MSMEKINRSIIELILVNCFLELTGIFFFCTLNSIYSSNRIFFHSNNNTFDETNKYAAEGTGPVNRVSLNDYNVTVMRMTKEEERSRAESARSTAARNAHL